MKNLLFLILILQSCSLFTKLDELDQPEAPSLKTNQDSIHCSIENEKSISIVGDSQVSVNDFEKFLLKNDPNKRFSFIERSILWSLIQMNYRPDIVTPTSKFQALITYNGVEKYWEFGSKSKTQNQLSHYPYLLGLSKILKFYKQKQSLMDLAKFLDNKLPAAIPIERGFSNFISSHQSILLQNAKFAANFFKAGEPLKESETIPKLNFQRLIRLYLKSKTKIPISHHLFTYKSSDNELNDHLVQCNFDLGLYQNSIYLISKNLSLSTRPFGYQEGSQNNFLAVSSQEPDLNKSLGNTYLFANKSYPAPSALCSIQKKDQSQHLSILSTTGRDPGQHLFHLIQYHLQKASSLKELSQFINFPRHMFLGNPDRMLYESARASEAQLDELLNLGFPIYHINAMGQIWIHGQFPNVNQSGFALDPRNGGGITCSK